MEQLEGRVAVITAGTAAADRAAAIAPPEVAERVLDGVRANRLPIFTHADRRAPLEERHRQTMAACDAIE
jgi:hypothetical protein